MPETSQSEPKDPANGGRPTQYRARYAKQAEQLCANGATDTELAEFFEVEVRTIYRWKLNYPKFCQAVKIGKGPADDRVELALYQSAISGNVTAQTMWLTNRRRDVWQNVKQHEHKGNVTLEMLVAGEEPEEDEGE